MKRSTEPAELAPAYVYLASDDSSYVVGQVIHVNGGSYSVYERPNQEDEC